ncbi:hypothetical protein [Verrucomicrobium sp. BvORR034]|uniref:hypothetical protein n=1 Tax=Verrucomicrobium sp. BvORR034 TaxID=1396418 RepID=UPI000678AC7F|nr:hypothetical protein [Verrucomicrobium sp. BvORR034]
MASPKAPSMELRRELQKLWNSVEELTSEIVDPDEDALATVQELVETVATLAGVTLGEYSGAHRKAYRQHQRDSGVLDGDSDPEDDDED